MQRLLFLGAAVIFLALALWLPKKIWIHHMKSRLAYIEAQHKACPSEACRERVNFELNLFLHDVENPPWYVLGAEQGGTPTW